MKKLLHVLMIFGFANFTIGQTCDGTLPVTEHFDTSSVVDVCWDLTDSDGDGQDWYWREYSAGAGGYKCLTSRSWSASGPLTPDNWITSYAIDLTSYSASETIELSWKVRGENAGFSHEKYSVYVATSNNLSAFTSSSVVTTEYADAIGAAGIFVTRSMDISSLAGNMVYVAFRHYDSTNQYILNIDDVSVTTQALGVEDLVSNASSLSHFYNSNSQELTVKSSNFPLNSINVYNILGQNVRVKNSSNTEETISLSGFNPGIYIAQVNLDGGETKTFKFVKN